MTRSIIRCIKSSLEDKIKYVMDACKGSKEREPLKDIKAPSFTTNIDNKIIVQFFCVLSILKDASGYPDELKALLAEKGVSWILSALAKENCCSLIILHKSMREHGIVKAMMLLNGDCETKGFESNSTSQSLRAIIESLGSFTAIALLTNGSSIFQHLQHAFWMHIGHPNLLCAHITQIWWANLVVSLPEDLQAKIISQFSKIIYSNGQKIDRALKHLVSCVSLILSKASSANQGLVIKDICAPLETQGPQALRMASNEVLKVMPSSAVEVEHHQNSIIAGIRICLDYVLKSTSASTLRNFHIVTMGNAFQFVCGALKLVLNASCSRCDEHLLSQVASAAVAAFKRLEWCYDGGASALIGDCHLIQECLEILGYIIDRLENKKLEQVVVVLNKFFEQCPRSRYAIVAFLGRCGHISKQSATEETMDSIHSLFRKSLGHSSPAIRTLALDAFARFSSRTVFRNRIQSLIPPGSQSAIQKYFRDGPKIIAAQYENCAADWARLTEYGSHTVNNSKTELKKIEDTAKKKASLELARALDCIDNNLKKIQAICKHRGLNPSNTKNTEYAASELQNQKKSSSYRKRLRDFTVQIQTLLSAEADHGQRRQQCVRPRV